MAHDCTRYKHCRLACYVAECLGSSAAEQWADARVHRIASPCMVELGVSSKLNAEWEFLCMLQEDGRKCMDLFLKDHAADLGKRSTFDLDSLLDTVLEQV